MTILAIHNYYQIKGGEDSVFDQETEALEKAGFNVIRYTKHNDETNNLSVIHKIKYFFSALYNFKTVKDIKKIIKNNQIDIAHIHNVFPLISPSVYNILAVNGIKIVQTLHNYRFLCPNGLFLRKNKICMLCKSGAYINCFFKKCYKNSLLY